MSSLFDPRESGTKGVEEVCEPASPTLGRDMPAPFWKEPNEQSLVYLGFISRMGNPDFLMT